MLRKLSIGKWRGLQQCSTVRGAIAILALDQRNNLRQALRPTAPETVTAEELTTFKTSAMAALAPAATAGLLDPEFGAAQCIACGALPGNIGLIVALEATGYAGEATARRSQLLDGWSAAKARQMGATAVKLLVYYHPQAATAPQIETLVGQVAADCAASDLPLCLEPLAYSLHVPQGKLAAAERRTVVIETAQRLTSDGIDLLKAEFPVDIAAEPDERIWGDACRELSTASAVPWVLLSAGVDYDTYLRQVAVACSCGASGAAAGRAIWQEATRLNGDARTSFLGGVGRDRMRRLTALVDELARPWMEFYEAPAVSTNWHSTYAARK